MSPNKRPATPLPILDFAGISNIRYFRGQWVYVENLNRLDPKLSWEAVNGTGIKWLSHNDPDELYNDEEPGPSIRLRSAENNFNKSKPEFSL